MPSSTEAGGISTRTILLVAAMILVVGSAPWWIQSVIVGSTKGDPQDQNRVSGADTAMVEGGTAQAQVTAQSGGAEGQDVGTGCTVTVLPTSVSVKRKPTGLNAGYARAESGEYAALGYKVIENKNETQGWYQIKVEGKKAWILHNSLTVLESGSCPP